MHDGSSFVFRFLQLRRWPVEFVKSMAGFDADTELQQPSEFALEEPHHDPSAMIEFNGSVAPAGVSPVGTGPASRWDKPHVQVMLYVMCCGLAVLFRNCLYCVLNCCH